MPLYGPKRIMMNFDNFPVKKSVGLLLDPDKTDDNTLKKILKIASESKTDYILAGGSLTFTNIDQLIRSVKEFCDIPVILFPGSLLQLSHKADAILLLSLISGRNPELLIGNHVLAAPYLKDIRSKLISTGYILVNCGTKTSVEYMSQTEAIPYDKTDIVVATALAGEMLGMKMIYLEAGSGAMRPIPGNIIQAVKENVKIPIAVGGGLRTGKEIKETYSAGADLIILGNGVEKDSGLLIDACRIRDSLKSLPHHPLTGA
jgi:putative glycerol-1-phosphate prenyltransferase